VLDESLRLEIARLQKKGATTESASGDQSSEVESHVDRLLKLLKKLESINDRADGVNSREPGTSQDFDLLVIAALREAECADLIEKTMEADLTALCDEIKHKNEALQAREGALAKEKESSKAQLAELETRIREQQKQLIDLQAAQRKLAAERDLLAHALDTAQATAKQFEAEAQQLKQRMEEELSALRQQPARREQSVDIEKREVNPEPAQGEQKKESDALQLRLQEMEAKLSSQEKELKEKEVVIRAAGMREAELGKLIQRLSTECEKLSAELCRNKLPPSATQDKSRRPFITGAKAWGKAARLLRAGRTPSDDTDQS
jgi:chromosome segregation ATPase